MLILNFKSSSTVWIVKGKFVNTVDLEEQIGQLVSVWMMDSESLDTGYLAVNLPVTVWMFFS